MTSSSMRAATPSTCCAAEESGEPAGSRGGSGRMRIALARAQRPRVHSSHDPTAENKNRASHQNTGPMLNENPKCGSR